MLSDLTTRPSLCLRSRTDDSLQTDPLFSQVSATDADDGLNAVLTYIIISSTPADVFAMNTTSGQISTKAKLDRETCSVYNLNVSASDHGHQVSQISFTTVVINVMDVNDHAPSIVNLPNRTNVSEDAAVGSKLFDVQVVDLDSGLNAEIAYFIISGEEKDIFF